jgi:DnaJ-class molecular chaperone
MATIKCPGCSGRGFHYGYAFADTHNVKFPCRRCSGRGTVSAKEPERRTRLRQQMEELRRRASEIEHRLDGAL